jgi:hypothetical protein
MPYLRITNIDITQESAWYYALLPNYNRKSSDVTAWIDPVPIINSSGFGIYTDLSGDFTFFRRNKSTGQVDYRNAYINCDISSSVVFVIFKLTAGDGYNFKVQISITETGGNSIASFEYGISNDENTPPSSWQVSNVFDLINEGVYYFDVRKIGQTTTVGKQSVELALTDSGIIGGGDESDNPTPLAGTSED